MKNVEEPIEVEIVDERPVAFKWRDRTYRVSDILGTWDADSTSWWKKSTTERRAFFRVQAGWDRHRITAELYAAPAKDGVRWVLDAIYR